ncbi:uncharacterized protein L969DRAFT_104747 [Mixia osmundae IAM 14324]|uniref:Enoyl reductase (ER) domain-containing protein n=1 Tax=Mixia osmundae (strain CBS 9802 / IAM 14324 / JCM 22182 / KY 12970) TaxID=764103 RepID=G7DWT7_MIXOS|nr:uncharacterized protein L969DRAFT_80598 [Mixia osmundae IAM 14324]XP_014566720.1 uncharacterized protein L969DRAFT_104747 [Mixia osmundae IAM 14324]KEI36189.1 hypothetical protein L969DRAFT_80598 [Mixia osmundae IAM 14324]KEI38157.1 hypothetical protein L969DRAFT_104747 [Mixia osmundae IAM 14324]GAA95034.1 hypothetical protein E5Q_01689 [Mixia osmundae IAM 14324]
MSEHSVSGLPKTYKAAQVKSKGAKFELIDVELNLPERGQVLVKVLACGVCHSDMTTKFEAIPGILPRVPGHEIIGDIVAIHESEDHWKLNDRVGSGWFGGSDGSCKQCRQGSPINCPKLAINGVTRDGGYAQYVTLRREAVVSVPKEMDPAEAAPLTCAGITTYNSMRNMGARPGDLVAIQGIGGLGSLAIGFARAMGFSTVALSSSSAKKDLATKLGAHHYLDSSAESQADALQKLGGAKLIVCTAPSQEVINTLLPALQPGGTLLLLAILPSVTLPAQQMVAKRLTVRGWPSGSPPDCEDCINFAQVEGVKPMIERYSLDDVEAAFERMSSNKARFRAVLIPDHNMSAKTDPAVQRGCEGREI